MSDGLASVVNYPIRAAQYLRMSSENQRYSTENQQNAIAEYAQQNGYQVVASYADAGKSGLSLKGRDALKQLLCDALATPRAFDTILVLDVSRWGRFQNPDLVRMCWKWRFWPGGSGTEPRSQMSTKWRTRHDSNV